MRTPLVPRSVPSVYRPGFTLVELLAVIAILSILMALLVPAIMNARRTALVTQVTTEIGTLASAIQNFKQDFGIEPPSFIVLTETGGSWSTASMAVIGRMWPQFDFTIPHDFNLDGSISGSVTLTGPECLVFFLGGPTIWNDTNNDGLYTAGETVVRTNGFSRNPANPFAPIPSSGGTNRQGPHFQFTAANRLVAIQSNSSGIGFTFGYSDPLSGTPASYLYLSSYEGQGYNPADLNGIMTDGYRNGTTATSPYYNPNGYQIISAGFDRNYGTGGPYQKGTDMGVGARDAERDNITNFSTGMLAP